AASTARAVGKSKCEPDFRSEAGDMETTIFVFGHGSRELATAVRIRSRDSLTTVSPSPTRWMPGSPGPMLASTVTIRAVTPARAMVNDLPSAMLDPLVELHVEAVSGGGEHEDVETHRDVPASLQPTGGRAPDAGQLPAGDRLRSPETPPGTCLDLDEHDRAVRLPADEVQLPDRIGDVA